jgi:hypothetical protein
MFAAIAALSGLLSGFDAAVVNGGLLILRAQFHLDLQAELAAGAPIVGAIFGGACAGWNSAYMACFLWSVVSLCIISSQRRVANRPKRYPLYGGHATRSIRKRSVVHASCILV